MPLGLTATGAFYYRLQTGAFDVFSVQPIADSVTPHRLSGRFRGSNIGASYSPDGTSVAYITVRDGYGSERDRSIVLRNLASGDERELHPLAFLGVAAPRWSPDGRQLLVRGSSPEHAPGIWAVDIATGRARHIVSPPSEKDETDIGPMGWDTTSDGAVYEHVGRGLIRHSVTTGEEQVLYAYGSGLSNGRIHRFGFNGSGGSHLAFSAFRNGAPRELVVVERGIERTVATVEAPAMLVFQGWSGDGAWIYYSVVPEASGPHEVWRVAADGGTPQRLPVKVPGATQINGVSVNPVSGELAYTAGTPTTETWMMENFLPREH
jgi:Tol biopolymer transport system component